MESFVFHLQFIVLKYIYLLFMPENQNMDVTDPLYTLEMIAMCVHAKIFSVFISVPIREVVIRTIALISQKIKHLD